MHIQMKYLVDEFLLASGLSDDILPAVRKHKQIY